AVEGDRAVDRAAARGVLDDLADLRSEAAEETNPVALRELGRPVETLAARLEHARPFGELAELLRRCRERVARHDGERRELASRDRVEAVFDEDGVLARLLRRVALAGVDDRPYAGP